MTIFCKFDEYPDYLERDANLAISSFRSLENLIAYSSHDKQQKILELLVNIVFRISNMNKKTDFSSELKKELESYYVHLVRVIILKLITPLKLNDAKDIYNILVQTFNNRGIYDEGILALSALAISKLF